MFHSDIERNETRLSSDFHHWILSEVRKINSATKPNNNNFLFNDIILIKPFFSFLSSLFLGVFLHKFYSLKLWEKTLERSEPFGNSTHTRILCIGSLTTFHKYNRNTHFFLFLWSFVIQINAFENPIELLCSSADKESWD